MGKEGFLEGEMEKGDNIGFPADLLARQNSSPVLARTVEDQRVQFDERKRSREAQVALIGSKILQLETETQGIAVEKASTEKQIGFIDDELVGLRDLQEKNLVPVPRRLAMEHERTRLAGVVGR